MSRRWLRPLDIRLVIRGDMAFLTAESTFTVKVLPSSDSESALLSGPGSVTRIVFSSLQANIICAAHVAAGGISRG